MDRDLFILYISDQALFCSGGVTVTPPLLHMSIGGVTVTPPYTPRIHLLFIYLQLKSNRNIPKVTLPYYSYY